MRNPQRARYLAEFLAPVLENAGDITAEPGSPGVCSCHEQVAGPAEPAVDFAIGLELREVWKRVPSPRKGEGEQATGEFSDSLTEVLESDDHAVGVLWALLAATAISRAPMRCQSRSPVRPVAAAHPATAPPWAAAVFTGTCHRSRKFSS
jgi:hypothetical protein